MFGQPFEPTQLIVEFRSRGRVTIGQVETANANAVDNRFNITAMDIFQITGKRPPDLPDFSFTRQDGYAIPTLLPVPERMITCVRNSFLRKFFLGRFQLLQTNDIRRCFAEPAE